MFNLKRLKQKKSLSISAIDAVVFDFDGVLTNNKVFVDQDGREIVCCSRADGLAFDILQKIPLKLFILSTETNSVVVRRGEKLRVPVFQGSKDKRKTLEELCKKENLSVSKILYVGNDVNDYQAMQISGFSACPADSHPSILEIATFRLKTNGGQGVVRELVEQIFGIDLINS